MARNHSALGIDYGGQYFAATKIDTENQIIAIFPQIPSQRQEYVV